MADIDYIYNNYDALVKEAYDYLQAQQLQIVQDFQLQKWTHNELDQENGIFIWGDGKNPQVGAQFQVVGSYYSAKRSWLWGWANDSLGDNLVNQIISVGEFGSENDIPLLYTPGIENIEEGYAHQITAIVAYLLRAKGFYRLPQGENLMYFLIFTDIQYAE